MARECALVSIFITNLINYERETVMISTYKAKLFSELILLTLSCLAIIYSNNAIAGVCDISGGSGIGGTGAPSYNSGIGGTGAVAFGSGIGGTGEPAKKNGSGIGGTGAITQKKGIGGTGQQTGVVVGTITGFGSICVNGIEIHYSASTPLQRDGHAISHNNALAIGQVVAVGVSGFGNEVTAKEMHILHAATGPVSSINIQKGEIGLLGQVVRIPANISNQLDNIKNIRVGSYIEVSGLRHPDGKIIASHINEVAARPNVSLRGAISSVSNNSFHIHGVKVNAPVPAGLVVGEKVEVSGRLSGTILIPDSIMLSQDRRLTAEVGGLVSLEGYLDSTKGHSMTEIAGRVIQIPAALNSAIGELSDQQKIIITGRLVENDVIRMEHIVIDDDHASVSNSTPFHDVKQHQREDKHDDNTRGENHDEEIEFSLETPEAEESEAPEVEETEAPEVEEIEVPEIEEIEVPEIEEIEVPEIEEIEVPEIEEIEVPEIEEIEVPEIEEIEVPEIEEIETGNGVIIPTGLSPIFQA
jgi:hypothetical protein